MVTYVSLGILVLLLGAQLRLRPLLVRHRAAIFWVCTGIIFGLLLYQTREQFLLLANSGPPSKYLVPPYNGIGYFLLWSWSWLWSRYLIALAGSLLLLCAIMSASANWRSKRFEEEEPYLLALSLVLVGHPFWIFYFFAVVLAYALYTATRAWRQATTQRVSFYYFWIPIALVVVGLTPWLKDLALVRQLAITLS